MSKVQIGLRLHDAVDLPLEERVKVVKEQGFTCVHMALSKVIREYSVGNSSLTPGLAMYLKKLFANNELDIAVLGCYLNLAHPEPEQLSRIQETYKAHIRFAKTVGAGVVGTETGAPNADYHYVPECHSEESLGVFIHNLRPIIEYASAMGVIVAIEPVWCHIVSTPKRAKRVLDEINSPNLQIILDPVNLLSIDNYERRDEIIEEAIELLGRDVAVVHLKDFIIKDNQIISVAAGTGMMNYEKIMTFLKKDKPYIHATLEDTNPTNAVAAREYIESVYQTV